MTIYRDMSLLHPKFARLVADVQKRVIADHKAGVTKTSFEIFETYRNPMRQKELIAKGVTKAGPYESAHQFGLAVDFVPVIDSTAAARLSELTGERVFPGWNWHSSHDWEYLTKVAKRFGLVTIDWDKSHLQHPHWYDILHKLKSIGGGAYK